jgi:hypothetical protein
VTEHPGQSARLPNDRGSQRLARWGVGLGIAALVVAIIYPILIPPSLQESINGKLVALVGLFAKGYGDSIFNLAAQDPASYVVREISNAVSLAKAYA